MGEKYVVRQLRMLIVHEFCLKTAQYRALRKYRNVIRVEYSKNHTHVVFHISYDSMIWLATHYRTYLIHELRRSPTVILLAAHISRYIF